MSSQEPGKRMIPNFIAWSPRAPEPPRSPSLRSADSPAGARTSRATRRGRPRRARSGGRRARCARRRSQAPGARAGPPGPAGRGFPLWAGRGREPSSGPLQPVVERLAADPLVGLDVFLTGPRDHLVRDGRGRPVAVPAGRGGPVANELLVEARLPSARLVLV